MLNRETRLGLRTVAHPEGLVVPLNVFDGKHFPPRAQSIQWFDLSDYWIDGPAFRSSSQYVDFQVQLKKLAPQVAAAIGRAPTWQDRWRRANWYDVDASDLIPPPIANFAFAGLE
jgi:hypothetical protein